MSWDSMETFASWVTMPENQAAQLATEQLAQSLAAAQRQQKSAPPLFLHGPAGTGKSHLVQALAAWVSEHAPETLVALVSARDFDLLMTVEGEPELRAARQADLLVVEDLQLLPSRNAGALASLLDHGRARGQRQLFTAVRGPAQLAHLPGRLASRLAAGVVVGLTPPGPESRTAYLRTRAAQRGLELSPGVLAWLADHLGGSMRRLDGALARLEALARLHGTVDEKTVADVFSVEAQASRHTVERIAQQVSDYFQVEPRQLQSRRRTRNALLPRQVGMYLARQLTALSLEQIGAYFGGRDHSTVLHACRKVEQALARDVTLSGAVRQLHADLA